MIKICDRHILIVVDAMSADWTVYRFLLPSFGDGTASFSGSRMARRCPRYPNASRGKSWAITYYVLAFSSWTTSWRPSSALERANLARLGFETARGEIYRARAKRYILIVSSSVGCLVEKPVFCQKWGFRWITGHKSRIEFDTGINFLRQSQVIYCWKCQWPSWLFGTLVIGSLTQ